MIINVELGKVKKETSATYFKALSLRDPHVTVGPTKITST